MRSGPLACTLVVLACAGCGGAAPVAEVADETEGSGIDRGFWVEQPNAGEIGVDWPPPQTVVEVELDASLSRGARLELRLDDQILWEGAYAEPIGLALPAGEHKLAVTVVAAEGAGRAETIFESLRGCRVRLTVGKSRRGVRLERSVVGNCESGSARALE